MPSKQKDMFLGLQVLRALAASIVLAGHIQHETTILSESGFGGGFSFLPINGLIGVDIFFVISGFVIIYASRNLFGQKGAFGFFMLRRIVRIIPVYWFYTTLLALVIVFMSDAVDTARLELWHLVQSYLFIPHIRPLGDAVRPLLSLGWSLNYEMYFYLLVAILLFLPPRKMITALSLIMISSVVIGAFIPETWVMLQFWFAPVVLEFLGGALLGYAYISGKRLPGVFLWLLSALGGVILLGLMAIEASYSDFWPRIAVFVAAMALVSGVTLAKGAGQLRPPKSLVLLGDSSYSLYLSHPFGIAAMKLLWVNIAFVKDVNLWLYVALSTIVCLIGGVISYLIVEKPIMNAFKPNKKRFVKE